MITSHTSKIYAQALMDIDSSIINAQIPLVIETMTDELKTVLENPSIPRDVKISIIDDVFRNKIDERILNFLKILVEKNKINILPAIYASVQNLYDDINGIKLVEITSAIDLDDSTRNVILKRIESKLNKAVRSKWLVDSNIIAGLIIKIEDTVFDSSLRSKIDNLRKDIRSVKWH